MTTYQKIYLPLSASACLVPLSDSVVADGEIIADEPSSYKQSSLQWAIIPDSTSGTVTISPRNNAKLFLSFQDQGKVVKLTDKAYKWKFNSVNEDRITISPDSSELVLTKESNAPTLSVAKKNASLDALQQWQRGPLGF